MKVSTLSLVAAALLGLSQAAIAETKIGFVNSDRVMREAAPAVRAQQRLEKEFEKRDQELQRIARDLKSMQEDLERNGPTKADGDRQASAEPASTLTAAADRDDHHHRAGESRAEQPEAETIGGPHHEGADQIGGQ